MILSLSCVPNTLEIVASATSENSGSGSSNSGVPAQEIQGQGIIMTMTIVLFPEILAPQQATTIAMPLLLQLFCCRHCYLDCYPTRCSLERDNQLFEPNPVTVDNGAIITWRIAMILHIILQQPTMPPSIQELLMVAHLVGIRHARQAVAPRQEQVAGCHKENGRD